MPSPPSPSSQDRGIDRRGFLTAAALGGATIVGASALGAFDADAAFAAPTAPLDPGVRETAFAEGVIVGRDGNLLVVSGSHGDTHRVQVTDATSIWKLHPTDTSAIEVGDGMYGRGVHMPDGTIAADAVWLNIVNLVGDVESLGRDRLGLRHGEHSILGRVVLGTTVASIAGRAATPDLSGLRIGHTVEVIGAWRPSDDSVDLARITARGTR